MAFQEKKVRSNERRSFQINIGLEEGYGTGIKHDADEVFVMIGEWMKGRLIEEKAVLTGGILIPGKLVYCWSSEATGIQVNKEDTLVFMGEVNPLYSCMLTDEEVLKLLVDLASFLGEFLKQTRMYVAYKDKIHIYENDRYLHPTGT